MNNTSRKTSQSPKYVKIKILGEINMKIKKNKSPNSNRSNMIMKKNKK